MLAARVARNFLLYLCQSTVFPVVVGKYFSGKFNLGSCLYDEEPVLV